MCGITAQLIFLKLRLLHHSDLLSFALEFLPGIKSENVDQVKTPVVNKNKLKQWNLLPHLQSFGQISAKYNLLTKKKLLN